MRDKSTLKGYSSEEVKLADKLLQFLANKYPNKKHCSFIEPTICDGCEEKIQIARFFLKLKL